MIHTKCYCGGDGSLHLQMAGHAGAGVKGADLVCAGASALACTLGAAVERMYEQQMLSRCPRVELGEGSADIIAVPKPRFRQETMMVFWTIQTGLGALAEAFPGNVSLEEAMRVAAW